jgi:hypothetical protein
MSARPGDVFRTSNMPRIEIVPCDPIVRQHAIVLFSAGDNAIRQRALDEIKKLMDAEEPKGALEVLQQFAEWQKR